MSAEEREYKEATVSVWFDDRTPEPVQEEIKATLVDVREKIDDLVRRSISI